ncbi:MAG: DUF1761 domain-containing protein [Candidatus Aenigmarchaeota archaeon]|nr:DUF1761 domain-containing protein [Candidatus Aenigmarchaeota archaeon]
MVLGSAGLVPIVVSAIASMIIGMIWYSPMLFGKSWMNEMKMNAKKMLSMKKSGGINKAYMLSFAGSLLTAYVLGYFVNLLGANTAMGGAAVGFWAWLGFVVTTNSSGVLYEGKSAKSYYIGAAHQLVNMMVMGAIVGMWV